MEFGDNLELPEIVEVFGVEVELLADTAGLDFVDDGFCFGVEAGVCLVFEDAEAWIGLGVIVVVGILLVVLLPRAIFSSFSVLSTDAATTDSISVRSNSVAPCEFRELCCYRYVDEIKRNETYMIQQTFEV